MSKFLRLWFFVLICCLAAYFLVKNLYACQDGLILGSCRMADVLVPISVGWSYVFYLVLMSLWRLVKQKLFRGKLGIFDVIVLGLLSLFPFFGYYVTDRLIVDNLILRSVYGIAAGLELFTYFGFSKIAGWF